MSEGRQRRGTARAGAARNSIGPVVLVASPHAGHAVGLARLAATLEAAGIAVAKTVLISELYEHQPEGLRWNAAGFRAAVAAGGDGTIGTVATHLAGSGLPMGILPMGTSNDVARSLRIPLELEAACRVIADGHIAPIDAGQTIPALTKPGALGVHPAPPPRGADAPASGTGAYFLHALTLGFNVEFARLATDVARRQRWGTLTYAASAIEALASFRAVPVALRVYARDDFGTFSGEPTNTVHCQAVQVVAINTPIFGGAMELRVPGVVMHDRLLDVLIIEALDAHPLGATIEGLLGALARLGETVREHLPLADHPDAAAHVPAAPAVPASDPMSDEALGFALPGVRRLRARAFTMETPEPVDVTMDGEVRAHTPVLVRAAPEPVRIFVPRESAAGAAVPGATPAAATEGEIRES